MSVLLRSHFLVRSTLRSNINKLSALQISRNCVSKATTQRDLNEPVKFVGSAAHAYQTKDARFGTMNRDAAWFQPYVVIASLASFLIYFCILREESDIDNEFGKTLYERVPGLEEVQLIINYKYNFENDIDNSQVISRMKELGMRPEDVIAHYS